MHTEEFIMWTNCTNKCKFCHQCIKNDLQTKLNEVEILECIDETERYILEIDKQCDVLLVGGEILAKQNETEFWQMLNLFNTCIEQIKKGLIRYLYVNTNLLYSDLSILHGLLNLFTKNNLEERLKFTTSYDIYGRFSTEESRNLFLENLQYIKEQFPTINTVVNVILTKQAIKELISDTFNPKEFQEKYGIKYINFIPYIPVPTTDEMSVSFKDIVKVLAKLEKYYPGYIQHYIDDMDLNQDKHLQEYKKDEGYVECTAKYSNCHHNVNFKRALPTGECYICKLIEAFR